LIDNGAVFNKARLLKGGINSIKAATQGGHFYYAEQAHQLLMEQHFYAPLADKNSVSTLLSHFLLRLDIWARRLAELLGETDTECKEQHKTASLLLSDRHV